MLYLKLCPDCIKPKLHLTVHVVDAWLKFGVLLSCFATERKHRSFKRTLQFAYKEYCSTALSMELRRLDRRRTSRRDTRCHAQGPAKSRRFVLGPGPGEGPVDLAEPRGRRDRPRFAHPRKLGLPVHVRRVEIHFEQAASHPQEFSCKICEAQC